MPSSTGLTEGKGISVSSPHPLVFLTAILPVQTEVTALRPVIDGHICPAHLLRRSRSVIDRKRSRQAPKEVPGTPPVVRWA